MEPSERRVTFEGCRCPGAPHRDGDWVEVVERVPIELGAAALVAGREGGSDPAAIEGLMARAFLRFGIDRWSFVDESGDPVAVDWEAIGRLLPFEDAYRVADLVGELHTGTILRPLLARSSTPSPDGPTADSTSASPGSGSTPRTRSERSSRTPTDGQPSEVPAP